MLLGRKALSRCGLVRGARASSGLPHREWRETRILVARMASSGTSTGSAELHDARWQSLSCPSSELRLEYTLPTGQSFRWRKTAPREYTGVIKERVVSMHFRYPCDLPKNCMHNGIAPVSPFISYGLWQNRILLFCSCLQAISVQAWHSRQLAHCCHQTS